MTEISVVVPAFRCVDTIGRCLDSLLDQTLAEPHYEVIVVSNGRDDGTGELLRAYRERAPDIVTIIDSPIANAGAARNCGVAAATGPWTTFVDADDWVSRDFLELLVASAHPRRVAVSGLNDVLPDGTINADTAVNRSIMSRDETRFTLAGSVTISAMNACKAIPTAWLREAPFPEHLGSGEDVVLAARLFGCYARQFTLADSTPARRGATYFRSLRANSISRRALEIGFAVDERLAVIAELTADQQALSTGRAPLVEQLIRGQVGFIRNFLAEHPSQRDEVWLRAQDVPACLPHLAVSNDPFERFFSTANAPRRLALAAASAATINAQQGLLRLLQRNGTSVDVYFVRGSIGKGLAGAVSATPLRPGPASLSRLEDARPKRRDTRAARAAARRIVRAGHRMLPEILPVGVSLALADKRSAGRPQINAPFNSRIALDDTGAKLLGIATSDHGTQQGGLQLAREVMMVGTTLQRVTRNDAMALREASRRLAHAPEPAVSLLSPETWAMVVFRLLRSRRTEAAAQLMSDAAALFRWSPEWPSSGLALTETIMSPSSPDDAEAATAMSSALAAADDALDDHDPNRAAFLVSLAAQVLFDPRHHTTVPTSPLIERPEDFLSVWRSSATVRQLERAGTTRPPRKGQRSTERRVLVLPGPYPRFADAVANALSIEFEIDWLRLADTDTRYASIGVDPREILDLIQFDTPGTATLDELHLDRIQHADTIFVDWADKALAELTRVVPADTRLIVRMHGVDSLSLWIHLVDWSAVSDLIFPSEHLLVTTQRLLGDRLATTRLHVVHNPVDLDRFRRPKLPGAEHTLGMVGWAQSVKDPAWTLDLLSILRSDDPRWRLLLIGPDFPETANEQETTTAADIRRRLLNDEIRTAVHFVGSTRDVASHLPRVGWGISSSLRESFHLGLVEMAASGAVPIVRDWPVYANQGGARTLFPDDWVVSTSAEAAQRILEQADTWAAVSSATLDTLTKLFPPGGAAEHLRDIVRGE
jgi:glycosyltransferase involved in cell wall biosynthesis